MKKLDLEDIQIGDWVRFLKSGRTAIGVVQYRYCVSSALTPVADIEYEEIITDIGTVSLHHVLEIRRDVQYTLPMKWRGR